MKKVLTVFLVLLIFLVILGGCALYLGYTVTNGNTNVRYVYVGDTNVSGLTRDETENLLVERGWKARAETPLVVTTYRDVSFEVEPLRAGTAFTVDSLVDAAFARPEQQFYLIVPEQAGSSMEQRILSLNKERTGRNGFFNIDIIFISIFFSFFKIL